MSEVVWAIVLWAIELSSGHHKLIWVNFAKFGFNSDSCDFALGMTNNNITLLPVPGLKLFKNLCSRQLNFYCNGIYVICVYLCCNIDTQCHTRWCSSLVLDADLHGPATELSEYLVMWARSKPCAVCRTAHCLRTFQSGHSGRSSLSLNWRTWRISS